MYCRGVPLLAWNGTDGRPIIRKKTSVTDRHDEPILLYQHYAIVLFLRLHQERDAPYGQRRKESRHEK